MSLQSLCLIGLRIVLGDTKRWKKKKKNRCSAIHCTLRSPLQSCYFAARQKDQTHKYCPFWDWWKTNSQLKSSLPLLGIRLLHSHFSSLLFFPFCLSYYVRYSLVWRSRLQRNLLYIFNDEDEAVSPAKVCPLPIATHFISQRLLLVVWGLNKHYADAPSSI